MTLLTPRHLATTFLLIALAACSSDPPDQTDAPHQDASAADGGSVADAAASPSPDALVSTDASDPWAEVDRLAGDSVRKNELSGLGVAVYDRDDRLVFRRMYGDFAPDRKLAIASASKMPAGMVLLELVKQGTLSLDSTTGEVLGWQGDNAAINLRQLLSFTSGLRPNFLCTTELKNTLADCVNEIRDSKAVAAPGTRYDYGNAHLHVAARMAEVATGKPWNRLFRELIADPLSLSEDVRYYTLPRAAAGTDNPLIAGGMRASMDDYAHILALAFHEGVYRNLTLANKALFAAQAREPYPTATIGVSPMANIDLPFRYGLACWLECATPATGCQVVSSPGAFGFTPWFDREAGYYAIIGTETGQVEGGVVKFSVGLAQALKPAIKAALAR